jgi:glycosyltransferase involved in cell wall biosynthesis
VTLRRQPQTRADGLPDGVPLVSIVTSGHDVADARLHRLAAALQRHGLTVEVLGLGDAAAAPPGAQSRTWPRPRRLERAILAARLGWLARGRAIVTLDPDSLLGAWAATRLRQRALVADVHEDYAQLLRDRNWATGPRAAVARALIAVAEKAAASAELTLVADEHVPPAQGRQRLVVRNEPDLSMLPQRVDPADTPRAVYVGDVRRSRGLFTMISALDGAPDWELDVIGPIATEDRTELALRLARGPDVARRIRWHGRLDPVRAWRVAEGAWVGLCLLEDTPAFREAVPSKLYEYLAVGLVPLVSDLPRQAELVRASGSGLVVRDAPDAAQALRTFADNPLIHTALRERALMWSHARRRGPSAYDVAAERIHGLLS